MDEPCSALDPIATAKIEELIHELRGRYAIAIVTHNMQQAARVSQRTAFFHLGEMVEYGDDQGHLHQPARAAHPGLHHRPLRLIGRADMAWPPPADIRSRRSTRISTGCARSSARWAAWPSTRSAIDALPGPARPRRRGQDRRGRQEARRARDRDRAARGAADRAARADGGRPARRRRGAEDLRRGRADRRLCQEHRQARSAARGRQDIEPLSLLPEMARIATEMVHDVLNAFVERDAEAALRGHRARQGGRRFLQLDLPHAAHLHDGKPEQHRPVGAPAVHRQESRAGRRPRHQHRRDGLLRRDRRAYRRPPEAATTIVVEGR